jgi:hypothetical protein
MCRGTIWGCRTEGVSEEVAVESAMIDGDGEEDTVQGGENTWGAKDMEIDGLDAHTTLSLKY